jgi:plasmid stability protein
MDKYIKRLQTRANRKGISVSKSQVRDVYSQVVATPESPSEEEMSAVIEALEIQYQAPSYEASEGDLTIPEPQITEITPESNPDIWKTLQPSTEEPMQSPIQEPEEMTQPSQPAQEIKGDLATSTRSNLSLPSETSTAITQQQIQDAVEMQFGRENIETKTAILNYIAQDTFATATELQQALCKLRQMRLDILLKLISDHNQQSSGDDNLIKVALL